MSLLNLTEKIPLHNRYYLFGVYYEPEVDVNSGEVIYPVWHEELRLDKTSLTNLKPLSKVPLLNVTDGENPQLWATDANFKLCKLANGTVDSENGAEVLKPESTIHLLGRDHPIKVDDRYTFRFPPLHLLLHWQTSILRACMKS